MARVQGLEEPRGSASLIPSFIHAEATLGLQTRMSETQPCPQTLIVPEGHPAPNPTWGEILLEEALLGIL